ncbi:MAG: hypothetical protein ACN6OC_10375 [Alcaligenes sp.]
MAGKADLKSFLKTSETVGAYFFTPGAIVTTTAKSVREGASSLDAALGALSIASGVVNTFGKSIPGLAQVASGGALASDIRQLRNQYKDRVIKFETLVSAISNLSAFSSAVGSAVLLGGTAVVTPAAVATVIGLATVGAGLAVVSTFIGGSSFNLDDTLEGIKDSLATAVASLGSSLTDAFQNVREIFFPALANKLEVLTVADGKVQLGTSQTGAQMQVDPAYLTDFGLDASGNLFAEVVLDSANPYSRVRIAFDETGTAGVTVDGRAAIYVTPGALIRVEDQALSVRMAEGSATGEYRLSLQNGTAYVEYNHGAGISGRWDVGANGSAQLARLTLNGASYSGSDPAAFIAQQGNDFAAQRAATQAGADGGRIPGRLVAVDGVAQARDNSLALQWLAERIALPNVSDRWLPYVMQGSVSAGVYLSWSQAGALNQALASIYQQRWNQAGPSIIDVTILGFGPAAAPRALRMMTAAATPTGFPVSSIPAEIVSAGAAAPKRAAPVAKLATVARIFDDADQMVDVLTFPSLLP